MTKFIPRRISPSCAAEGYNNEGRGKLIGYIAAPAQHEKICRYRVSTGGNPDKRPQETCNCRIGLWQEKPKVKPRVRVKAGRAVLPSSRGSE